MNSVWVKQMSSGTTTYLVTQGSKADEAASRRVDAIDIVRGLAMIFMLLNHSSWHIPGLHLEANNSWYDRSAIQALSGTSPEAWLNILQGTPLFFVLAGFSVAFFERSRRKRGWTEWDISRYLLIRGGVLALIDLVLPGFVLSSIALCLWMIAFLRQLPVRYLVVLAVLLTVSMQLTYESVDIPNDVNIIRSIFLYPSPMDPISFGYPVLQWLAVIILGYASGRLAITHRDKFTIYAMAVGLISFVIWIIVTVDNEFGRLFKGHPMILTKHPPSVAYLSFYMGMAFSLLALFSRLRPFAESMIGRFLALLGQVAFFFYLTHFLVVYLISIVVTQLPFAPLMLNFIVMAAALAVLFPVCQKYKTVRRNHPDSILQYL